MGSILKMAEDKKQKIMRVKQFQKTMQEEEMKAITEKLDIHERKLSLGTSINQSFITNRVESVRNRN